MAKMEAAKLEAAAGAVDSKGPTTFFHGKEKEDYQGRCGGGKGGGGGGGQCRGTRVVGPAEGGACGF